MVFEADPSDVLLTLAEVAVAFAGFASIVAIFRTRAPAGAPFELFRFWVMLAFSLAALLFALLPFPLHFLLESPSQVWRSSSLALVVFIVVTAATIGRLAVRQQPMVVAARTRAITVTAQSLYALILLSQLANAFGFAGEPGFGLYLAGVLLVLLAAGINFVRLLWVASALPEATASAASSPHVHDDE